MRPSLSSTRTDSKWTTAHPDPSKLEWTGDWDIGKGALVGGQNRTGKMGYLTVPLDYYDPDSPKIKLRVRVALATSQPAEKGPILFHCGGPGSTDDCMRTAHQTTPD